MVEIKDKRTYFDLIRDFEYIPFSQSEGWHDFHTCLKPNSTRFFVDNAQHPTIALFGHVKKFFGLRMLLIEGECLLINKIDNKKITEFFGQIQDRGIHLIEINSNHKYDHQFEIGIRRAGYLRPVGMFSMHLSSWIDLSKKIKYNNNWKRNLKIASQNQLEFRLDKSVNDLQIAEFVNLYNRHTSEKNISHSLSFEQVKILIESQNFEIAFVYMNKELVSAILFSICNKHAGLTYAAKNKLAIGCGSTFYMYDCLFNILAERGMEIFDLEKLLPSTHSTDGVFLFKQGIKGEYVIYNGEWSWYKYPILRPIMYFVKKFLFKRVEV